MNSKKSSSLSAATTQSTKKTGRSSSILGSFPETKSPESITFDRDGFEVPKWLAQEIHSQGFTYKWINRKKYRADGFHKRGWEPYKLSKEALENRRSDDRLLGFDPDGFFARNDNILAIRSKEVEMAHRRHLAEKTRRSSPEQFKANKKAELQDYLAQAGDVAGAQSVKSYDESDD